MPENRGEARAIEASVAAVDSDLVAPDADSIVHPEYVREMLVSFQRPEIMVVGGSVEASRIRG